MQKTLRQAACTMSSINPAQISLRIRVFKFCNNTATGLHKTCAEFNSAQPSSRHSLSKICADQTRAQFSQTDADSQSVQSVNPAQFLCKSCAEHTLSRICAGLSHTQLDKSTPCAKSARSSLSPGCVSPAGRRRASLVCPSPPPRSNT